MFIQLIEMGFKCSKKKIGERSMVRSTVLLYLMDFGLIDNQISYCAYEMALILHFNPFQSILSLDRNEFETIKRCDG